MDQEEIETIYKQDLEEAEKSFLEGLKKGINKSALEKKYSENFQYAKNKYYKSMSYIIEKQKKDLLKKPKKTQTLDKIKPFKVEPLNLELTRYQKFKLELDVRLFRWNIALKNFYRKYTPLFLILSYIRAKIHLKRTVRSIKETITGIIESLGDFIKSVFKKISSSIKYLSEKFSAISSKMLSIFSKKKEEKKEDKKN